VEELTRVRALAHQIDAPRRAVVGQLQRHLQ
jgi:hypothetical protein